MIWLNFPLYAGIAALLWVIGSIIPYLKFAGTKRVQIANLIYFSGSVVIGSFIVILWSRLDRPPLRTLGETRLWYAFFLSIVGLITNLRWKYKWFMGLAAIMAISMLGINLTDPSAYNKTLMPALQSPWFVPHVVVYILSYSILAASSLVAIYALWRQYRQTYEKRFLNMADNLVYIGFAFLTLGQLFGALWAKEAWGHYWTWDPKETWAFLTWISFLIYIHYRFHKPKHVKGPLWTIALAFVVLLIAWFGVNYLPSAQDSVHVYSKMS